MSSTPTPPTADGAGGLSPKAQSAMLKHYLDSSLEIFERLSLELPPSNETSKKKVAKKRIKKYLDDWDKTWVKAGKSDSK